MNADSETITVDGTTVRAGTALYDTAFDRVLWVREIGDYELTVEVAEEYSDDDPVWWSPGGDPTRVSDGSRIVIDRFRELVEAGRFEVGAQPSEVEGPR